MTLLGINIDHVATVRQARRERFPDPTEAAIAAVKGGADSITAHLREDRRHIQDSDIEKLKKALPVPLNLEMAPTEDILLVAERIRPAWACFVPEKRQELTTEGGLSVGSMESRLTEAVKRLHGVGTKVSFFVEADPGLVAASARCGADAIEIHTGIYAKIARQGRSVYQRELDKITKAGEAARAWKIFVNAGHGIDYDNVAALAAAHEFHEFNIGFSVVARSVFVGIEQAVREMKARMATACAES